MKKIAIVGFGFSGLAAFYQLAKQVQSNSDLKDSIEVTIFEEHRKNACGGIAYQRDSPNEYALLNVPAGSMSIDPSEPDGFVDFVVSLGELWNSASVQGSPSVDVSLDNFHKEVSLALEREYSDSLDVDNLEKFIARSKFFSRSLYRAYLEFVHKKSSRLVNNRVMYNAVISVDIDEDEEYPIRMFYTKGSLIGKEEFSAVIFCTGHVTPTSSIWRDTQETQRLDPILGWDGPALEKLSHLSKKHNLPAVVIGTGHTAVEAACFLAKQDIPVVMTSRRGLLPNPHRVNGTLDRDSLDVDTLLGMSPRQLSSFIKNYPEGWHRAINSIRPHIPQIWANLSDKEKKRFLSRYVPFWDVHRHRLPHSTWEALELFIHERKIQVFKGHSRVSPIPSTFPSTSPLLDLAEVSIKRPGALQELKIQGLVVTATGPKSFYDRGYRFGNFPLIYNELSNPKHPLTANVFRLGPKVDDYRVVFNKDRPPVYCLGPFLKGMYWESIAVPELRVHAEKMSAEVLKAL